MDEKEAVKTAKRGPNVSIGSYILIKNEIQFIRMHLESWLPFLDELVFFDGNSTDGTLEVIKEFQKGPMGHKIILKEDKDPKDLQDDYVRLFDEALRTLTTDFAFFLHPDMLHISGGENLRNLTDVAWFTHMESYAGDMERLFKVVQGRMEPWKNIMRLHNPDLGLHYFGHYGNGHEDMYFREITGDEHKHSGFHMDRYPYEVKDSGVKIAHFSDVRPYARRLSRMEACLKNQGYSAEMAKELAPTHARVTLKDGMGFKFEPCDWPIKELCSR